MAAEPRESRARILRAAGSVVSGLAMAAAFPPLEWSGLAWVAWIPLVYSVRFRPAREAAGWGFLSGAIFWLFSISWLTKVTAAGWAGLALYCALFFVPFAVFVARWTARFGMGDPGANLGLTAGGAAVWTGFERLRYVLFTGFPWNAAGVSQYRNIPLIQLAAWGGVFAVSAAVLLGNLALAAALARFGSGRRFRAPPELAVALLAVAGGSLHGVAALRGLPPGEDSVRLALVQPAIPQHEKWTPEFIQGIYSRLVELSEVALRAGRPDLLVWPETVIPESLRPGGGARPAVERVTRSGPPLLLGAIEAETDETGTLRYYNRSLLVGAGPEVLDFYDKQHLVLYGEYVPFGDRLPFLRSLTPFETDITPGTVPAVFELESKRLRFSPLICFEDAVPRLGRKAALAGARLLVNQTNDAWFDVSSASRQHLAQAVFRCVENRLPMARSGNTGLTGWIDEAGRIGGAGGEARGLLPHVSDGGEMLSGFLTAEIPFRRGPVEPTLYTQRGDWFGSGLLLVAAVFWLPLMPRRGQRAGTTPEGSGRPDFF